MINEKKYSKVVFCTQATTKSNYDLLYKHYILDNWSFPCIKHMIILSAIEIGIKQRYDTVCRGTNYQQTTE